MSKQLTTREKIEWIIENEETEIGEGYHGLHSFLVYCTTSKESDRLLAILKETIDIDYEEIKQVVEDAWEEEIVIDAKGHLLI